MSCEYVFFGCDRHEEVCYPQNLYPYTYPKGPFDEQCQWDSNFPFQLNETVIRNNLRKKMAQMFADPLLVEMFKTTIVGIVKTIS